MHSESMMTPYVSECEDDVFFSQYKLSSKGTKQFQFINTCGEKQKIYILLYSAA